MITSKEEALNILIKGCDTNRISDGYHTFEELYEHRIVLYIALVKQLLNQGRGDIWKTQVHSDGSVWDGWFLLGIGYKPGEQITYHLPMRFYDDIPVVQIHQAPEFDGHSSSDVLERIKHIL